MNSSHLKLVPFLALLMLCSCQQTRQTGMRISEFTRNLIDYMSGNTPINAALQMEDRYFPDERRIGINKLVARPYGKQEPYTLRYRQIAQLDADPFVRSVAIRALNRSRDAAATSIFIQGLRDPAAEVRLESAKALANIPEPLAIPDLLRIVEAENEDRDVRIAAADALKHYQASQVSRALVNQLDARELAIAYQSRQSLIAITGQDHRYNTDDWLAALTAPPPTTAP